MRHYSHYTYHHLGLILRIPTMVSETSFPTIRTSSTMTRLAEPGPIHLLAETLISLDRLLRFPMPLVRSRFALVYKIPMQAESPLSPLKFLFSRLPPSRPLSAQAMRSTRILAIFQTCKPNLVYGVCRRRKLNPLPLLLKQLPRAGR